MILQRSTRLKKKFQAPVPTQVGGLSTALKVLPQFLASSASRSPRTVPGPFRTDPSIYSHPPGSGLRITWFGHSSLLFEIDGITLLIDPVWDKRAAPVQWAGPKRFFPPTLSLDGLPPLDAVLFSHDHYDHLGAGTVRQLAALHPQLRFICPLAVGSVLEGFGVAPAQITELDWLESTVVHSATGSTLDLTAVPARHFSGRSALNRNETLWAAFVLRGDRHNVLYGADSGLWPGYTAIARDYGPFDLTLLEIGAFNELWRDIHLGPDGALEAFNMVGGGTLMPIHWGLFDLALHPWRQPIERLTELADQHHIHLFSPTPGEPTEFVARQDIRSDWWKRQG